MQRRTFCDHVGSSHLQRGTGGRHRRPSRIQRCSRVCKRLRQRGKPAAVSSRRIPRQVARQQAAAGRLEILQPADTRSCTTKRSSAALQLTRGLSANLCLSGEISNMRPVTISAFFCA